MPDKWLPFQGWLNGPTIATPITNQSIQEPLQPHKLMRDHTRSTNSGSMEFNAMRNYFMLIYDMARSKSSRTIACIDVPSNSEILNSMQVFSLTKVINDVTFHISHDLLHFLTILQFRVNLVSSYHVDSWQMSHWVNTIMYIRLSNMLRCWICFICPSLWKS